MGTLRRMIFVSCRVWGGVALEVWCADVCVGFASM